MKPDLTRVYKKLLRLYPRDQRLLFEVEMANTFAAVAEECFAMGWAAVVRFVLTELIGLSREIVGEWNIKFAAEAFRSANLVRARSLLAEGFAALIHAAYESDSRFKNRCGRDPRMMRPAWISWNDWYGDGLWLDDSSVVT